WMAPCTAQQWQQAVPSANAQMVYDVVGRCTRLFVPAAKPTPHTDTWDFAANVWHQRFPSTLPPGTGPATYDLGYARTVMVLGDPQPATWEFDGIEWRRATTLTVPSARKDSCIAYHLAR